MLLRVNVQSVDTQRFDIQGIVADSNQPSYYKLVWAAGNWKQHSVSLSGSLSNKARRKNTDELANIPVDATKLSGWGVAPK